MKKIVVILVVFLMSACSPISNIKTEQKFKKSLSDYSSITVNVTGDPLARSKSEFSQVKANILNAIATKIKPRTGLEFKPESKAADISINVNVNHFTYTGQSARILLGSISGFATIATDVELVELKTGEVLWKVSTAAYSKDSQGMFASSTTTQIEALSNQIVTALQSNM